MNTKKLVFGLLAVVMLVAASASAYAIDGQDTGVRQKQIAKQKR